MHFFFLYFFFCKYIIILNIFFSVFNEELAIQWISNRFVSGVGNQSFFRFCSLSFRKLMKMFYLNWKERRKKKQVSCYCLCAMRITFNSSFCINNTEYRKKFWSKRERGKENMEINFAIFSESGSLVHGSWAYGVNNWACVYSYNNR